ncbi:MAG: sulfatase [Verrucomicrobiales bacterium]|nr:sulfatase [Verrucomicrobiales bacterium]
MSTRLESPPRVDSARPRGQLSYPSQPRALALLQPSILWLGVLTLCAADSIPTAAPGPKFNIVLISATNTRADHLGVYGYARPTSPHLDAFARQGIVMRQAFTHASWTLPVAVSLFTSQYPFTHGLMNRDENPVLPPSVPTFVDVLKAAGYTTAAFVGDRDYSIRYGHTARFDTVFDAVTDHEQQDWKTYGVFGQTLPPARKWLEANHQSPFCLLIQGYDTHCPFASPAEHKQFDSSYRGDIDFTQCYWTFEPTKPIRKRSPSGLYQDVYVLKSKPGKAAGEDYEVMFYPEDVRHMIALYDGEIANVDRMLGGLFDDLERLGLAKNTIVVFYSDHGDMFGKHGRFMRGGPLRGTFYDDVLHIPLLIRHPSLPSRSVDVPVEVVDIAPTLLELLKLPSPATFVGRSFAAALEGRTSPQENSTVFAGSAFTPAKNNQFFKYPSTIMSARNSKWKLIVERVTYPDGTRDSVELYELERDPEELKSVALQHPEKVREMRAQLLHWLRRINAQPQLKDWSDTPAPLPAKG